MKNHGEVYDQKMGVLAEEIGGRNHQEVALRTTLMICSDQRCGDGGRTASVVKRAIEEAVDSAKFQLK